MTLPAEPVQPSAEVAEHDQKVHDLIKALTEAVASIPGVTEMELLGHVDAGQTDAAFWGFDFRGLPCSLSWNITP